MAVLGTLRRLCSGIDTKPQRCQRAAHYRANRRFPGSPLRHSKHVTFATLDVVRESGSPSQSRQPPCVDGQKCTLRIIKSRRVAKLFSSDSMYCCSQSGHIVQPRGGMLSQATSSEWPIHDSLVVVIAGSARTSQRTRRRPCCCGTECWSSGVYCRPGRCAAMLQGLWQIAHHLEILDTSDIGRWHRG